MIFAHAEITITGNSKTPDEKIKRIARITDGKIQESPEVIEQRLLGTGLFSQVKVKTQGSKSSIDVTERWTFIPIIKFSSGGGVSQTTLGAYEANLFGSLNEVGLQYERLEDTNSGVTWYKSPYLFSNRTGIDLQLWRINRLRTKYNQKEDDPIVDNGFLHIRDKAYLGLTHIFHDKLKTRLFYEYNLDEFSDRLVPEEAQGIIKAQGLPPNTEVHFAGIGFELGQLYQDDFLIDGTLLTGDFQYGFPSSDDVQEFFLSNLTLQYFKTLGRNTFAQRVMTGATDTNVLQYWNYLGGLDRIRGFVDNRFAGRYFWLSNSEFRIPLIEKESWVLQGTTFLDLVSTSEYFKGLGSLTASSAGAGARIILPKIYRFVFRLDWAKPIKKNDNNEISFGVQQFF